jgi:hypothetical protein
MVLSTGKEQISVSLKDLESVITNDISIEPDEKEGKITVRLIKREPPTPVIDIKEGKKEAKKK